MVAWKVATELHRELGMTVCKLGGKAKKEARRGRECIELSTGAQSNAAESEKRYRRSRHWEGHGRVRLWAFVVWRCYSRLEDMKERQVGWVCSEEDNANVNGQVKASSVLLSVLNLRLLVGCSVRLGDESKGEERRRRAR